MRGRGRLIVTIVLAVLVCLLFYFFAIRSRTSELDEVKDQVAAAEQETIQLQAELTRLRDLQENAPQLEAELAEIRELVPRTNEVPNFIFLVQEAANASGVGFLKIEPQLPKPPPEGATLAEVRTVINAKGGYFAIQDFVRRLYNLDRALRIDILNLTGETDPISQVDRVSLDITARIFFELPPSAVTTAPGTTVPGATPSPTPTAVP